MSRCACELVAVDCCAVRCFINGLFFSYSCIIVVLWSSAGRDSKCWQVFFSFVGPCRVGLAVGGKKMLSGGGVKAGLLSVRFESMREL